MSSQGVITILLLRHGERADETESFEASLPSDSRSTKDYLDPPLTDEGHQQATEAFGRMMPFLKGKKVAVFASPLQRTIATAAMIGMFQSTEIEFAVPGGNNKINNKETIGSSSTTLPLIVLNGLSDCAAHVQIVGGAFAAVRKGYIDGAAMAANHHDDDDDDNRSSHRSPLLQLLARTPRIRNLLHPIQFFKEHEDGFVPMCRPIGGSESTSINHLQPKHSTAGGSTFAEKDAQSTVNTTPVARRASDDCFFATMNRLVKIATSRDCHVCVVVTHREGIRYLAQEVIRRENKHQRHSRISTPYCCIGHFSAQIEEHADRSIKWKLHGVVPYQEFGS